MGSGAASEVQPNVFREHVGSRASLNVWGPLLLAASDATKALRSNPKYREAFIFEKHGPNQTSRVAEKQRRRRIMTEEPARRIMPILLCRNVLL